MKNLKQLLASRSLPLVAGIIAVALASPSLTTGWQQDDLVHRYFLLGNPGPDGARLSPLDLFEFIDGTPERTRALIDAGVIPWWTLPTLKISFWRPLSALSHWLDYLVWPQSAPLMHVQSLLWFAGVIVGAALLYRRMMGATWVAGLAALFFALDDAHGLAAGWLANRNALIAGFFGILALASHDRWRREGWKAGALLGPALFSIALLAGESALAVPAYLLAYAAFVETGKWRRRLSALLPYAFAAAAYVSWYGSRGYGTSESGFYVDPLGEPLAFLSAVAWKGPVLLADQWFLPPSSFVLFMPPNMLPLLVLWALLILGLLAYFLYPLLKTDRLARYWAAGMLLSIPLVCSTMPHGRLLLFAGIGAFGLLAQWFEGILGKAAWVPKRNGWRRGAHIALGAFLLIHVLVAGATLPLNATSAAFSQRFIQDPAERLQAGEELRNQDLVILNHPVPFYALYLRTSRLLAGQPYPATVRSLASGLAPMLLRRTDEQTLVIRPEGGFLASPFDGVFRGTSHPMRAGDSLEIKGMRIKVLEVTADGRPALVAFRFSRPLEDAALRWVRWEGESLVPFELPRVGKERFLPRAATLF
jgi:hypothetical protein